MQPLKKQWIIKEPIPKTVSDKLQRFDPIMRQILYNRGLDSSEAAERFLHSIPPPDSEPENMKGIPEAVDRIRFAIQQNEDITVYGDYDVDGVTSTALLTQILQSMGAKAEGYIPNRFDEGYGLNREALRFLHDKGTQLVITVDCGIRSPAEVAYANSLGMDVIISDHHHPGEELPPAVAIINPKQPGDTYPDKDLAGVGLAYKIAEALLGKYSPAVFDTLDLVALGTVADLAPLRNENRSLVSLGLEHIRRPHRQGMQSLIGVTRLKAAQITARDIGFVLGPRLNAAGRLDTAYAALDLLLTPDVTLAAKLAQRLDVQNHERQKITREVQEHAEKQVLTDGLTPPILFAADPSYNSGVVGLAASRLTDRYYRPAIVAYIGEEFTRGSCRSIPEFHITKALDACADLLERHGGHAAAAGFTVRNENLVDLKDRLSLIADVALADRDLRPSLIADIELSLSDLKPELLEYLIQLEPTGMGNPKARFVSRHLKVTQAKIVGKEGTHLKLTVSDGSITYDAIAFRQGHWKNIMPKFVDLLFTFEKNHFRDRTTLQLNVLDIKPSGESD
jgi:single-stranded-DNA-specific exonuclease